MTNQIEFDIAGVFRITVPIENRPYRGHELQKLIENISGISKWRLLVDGEITAEYIPEGYDRMEITFIPDRIYTIQSKENLLYGDLSTEALSYACYLGILPLVQQWIASGADVSALIIIPVFGGGITMYPITYTCRGILYKDKGQHLEITKLLIECGLDVNREIKYDIDDPQLITLLSHSLIDLKNGIHRDSMVEPNINRFLMFLDLIYEAGYHYKAEQDDISFKDVIDLYTEAIEDTTDDTIRHNLIDKRRRFMELQSKMKGDR